MQSLLYLDEGFWLLFDGEGVEMVGAEGGGRAGDRGPQGGGRAGRPEGGGRGGRFILDVQPLVDNLNICLLTYNKWYN